MTYEEIESLRKQLGYEFRPEAMKAVGKQFKTKGLFKETVDETHPDPVFTLKPYDNGGLLSMKEMYLALEDPTEYIQAMVLLGSFDHWKRLKKAPFFKKYLLVWREELEVRLRSKALLQMKSSKSSKTQEYFANAKWKLEARAGRPGNKSKEHKDNIESQIVKVITSDADRMGIK